MNFSDPIILICAGILLVGFVLLVWLLNKLRSQPSQAKSQYEPADDDLRDEMFPSRAAVMRTTAAPAPAPTREVSDRLEAMTQRLAEMQGMLNKQLTAPQAPASIGQGFSPETIDKLLKIIGNVIQQVEILQKSMNIQPPAPKL